MSQFMLLIRGGYEKEAQLSPEEIQQRIAQYGEWAGKLQNEGKLVSAEKVKDEGRLLTQENGRLVAHEVELVGDTVGGYFIIEAANLDEAVAIAKESPTFSYEGGGMVEVREVDNQRG